MDHAVFDTTALYDALDVRRTELGIGWYELADRLWDQSADLNAQRDGEHTICGGAVQRIRDNGATSCQYALFMLRWLERAPEDFLVGPTVDVGGVTATRLPDAGPDARLRFDLPALHAALDERRRRDGLTWVALGRELGCTPARLTNLRTARLADMDLTLRVTQYLGVPAARFVRATDW